jgi:hypothetical protein
MSGSTKLQCDRARARHPVLERLERFLEALQRPHGALSELGLGHRQVRPLRRCLDRRARRLLRRLLGQGGGCLRPDLLDGRSKPGGRPLAPGPLPDRRLRLLLGPRGLRRHLALQQLHGLLQPPPERLHPGHLSWGVGTRHY